MFKKTLIASAILGVVATGALAAQVEVYGRIDTGFSYTKNKLGVDASITGGTNVPPALSDLSWSGDDHAFSMDSGNSTGSRWGLRGSEDLGNGLKVGFVLESGFDSDTGALGSSGTIFNRESTLWLEGGFGRVYAGRMSTFLNDAGSTGFYGGLVSPFGTGWGKLAGHAAVMAGYDTTRNNNAITYVSPTFAGLTVYAQYAMGSNDNENESTSDRYAALGASYINGPIQVAAVMDYLNKRSAGVIGGVDGGDITELHPYIGEPDDAWTFNLGGAYDFEVAKVYGAVQYFKNATDVGGIVSDIYGVVETFDQGDELVDLFHSYVSVDGWGVNIGTDVPLAGGLLKLSAGYMDGEFNNVGGLVGDFISQVNPKMDVKAYNIMAGYEYPFSKRTNVYFGAGYTKRELEIGVSQGTDSANIDIEHEIFQAMFGLVHKF